MSLFHDGPSDVLKFYSGWGSGAYYPEAYTKPTGWTNGLMWFHITEDCVPDLLSAADRVRPWRNPGPYTGNTSTNTRVQCRDLQLWFLLPNGTWYLHGHTVTPGSYMPPISWGNETGALTNSTWRAETVENGGGGSIKSIGYGQYEDHVWHSFTSPAQPLPTSYLGIASCFYGRLILDDPGGVDDRANAHILGAGAGDYYENQAVANGTVPKTVGGNVNPMGYSRFKYFTNDWQLFGFYSNNTLSQAAFRANPPPIIGLSLLENTGEPDPVFVPLTVPSRGTWFPKLTGGKNTWTTHTATATPPTITGIPPILRRRKRRVL